MKKNKIQVIKDYYDSKSGKKLPDYALLGWESQEAQRRRFKAFLASVPLEGKKLLDVGCGTGSLLEYIAEREIKARYTGVDLLQEMIDRAERKNLGGDFRKVDIFKDNPFSDGDFNVVYTSGIFNLNLGNNMEFLSEALNLFFRLSTEYVAISLLSCNSADKEEKYYYYRPEEVKALLQKQPCRLEKTTFISDYQQNDFTVICKKG